LGSVSIRTSGTDIFICVFLLGGLVAYYWLLKIGCSAGDLSLVYAVVAVCSWVIVVPWYTGTN
jgi:hypothetical protein